MVFLVAAAVFAVGDWVARLRRNARLEYLCKPATLLALIAVAVALTPVPDLATRRWWFVVALIFSLAGDVLLMIPADLFVAGLASFLVAHLAYLAGFSVHGPGGRALAIALVVVAVLVTPFGVRILRALGGQRQLLAPVALYMVVISVMVASALATGNVIAGVGAALFVSSDTMIAWNRFVRPFRAADVGIMVTYHLGQGALVLSLLR
jgi:alkenylglycerophosphocholine/alkenylglycerophosphoethanolamine hydrolase